MSSSIRHCVTSKSCTFGNQKKKMKMKINELLLAGNATCLVVHATLILKGNNKKKKKKKTTTLSLLTDIIHIVCASR